ncbi:UNVERIFIED_CONTAM: hypothetical protein BEN50_05785 [Euhalothece sp. KZN 001]
MAEQIISTSSVDPQDSASSFTFEVEYTTEPLDETLGGLGLRLHFDSSAITFDELTNIFDQNNDFPDDEDIEADTNDLDGDPNTDQYVGYTWSDFSFPANWPGEGETPTTLYTANFTTSDNFNDDTTLNFTASTTAPGYTLDAPPITIESTNTINKQVISTSSIEAQPADSSFSFDVEYTTEPLDETLGGLGLRLHFDSSVISFDELTNVFDQNSDVSVQDVNDDAENFDNDPQTDKFVLYSWANFEGNWPGDGETPTLLYTANFTTSESFDEDTTLNFTASSANGYVLDASSIAVQVNEAPSLDNTNTIFSLEENSSDGTSVGTLTANDPEGDSLSYSIVDSSEFSINDQGEITVADSSALDFETNSSFGFDVEVSDGNLTDSATVTVNLDDVNESPSLEDISFSLEENSSDGTSVGTLTANDPEGDSLSYSILNSSEFSINNQGEITVADSSALDFETNSSFGFDVEVSDGNLTDSATVTVNLDDVNESPSLEDISFSLAENSSNGTSVGTLTANDPDGDTLSYSILNSSEFSINNQGEITVADSNALEFETNSSLSFNVEVNDGNLTDSATVTVNLDDVNESPSLEDISFSLEENSSDGTSVGTLTANDPDGDTLSYSIVDSSEFSINDQGEITVADSSALDFETNPSFAFDVEVSDGNLTDTASVAIDLENQINENGFTYDVDQNGEIDGLTDGILIIRHLFGVDGPELTDGAIAENAQRTNPDAIANYLDSGVGGFNLDNQGLQETAALDLDLNSELDALTDGMILARILLEFSQDRLVDGAIAFDSPLINENNPNEQVMNFVESNNFLL